MVNVGKRVLSSAVTMKVHFCTRYSFELKPSSNETSMTEIFWPNWLWIENGTAKVGIFILRPKVPFLHLTVFTGPPTRSFPTIFRLPTTGPRSPFFVEIPTITVTYRLPLSSLCQIKRVKEEKVHGSTPVVWVQHFSPKMGEDDKEWFLSVAVGVLFVHVSQALLPPLIHFNIIKALCVFY